jgi:hypothetical protein
MKMSVDQNSPQEENSLVLQSDQLRALIQKALQIDQLDSEEAESEQEQKPQVIVEKREGISISINISSRSTSTNININNFYYP